MPPDAHSIAGTDIAVVPQAGAPKWFRDAVAVKGEVEAITSQGTRVLYQHWDGPHPDAPLVILVHGSGAHSRWWDFVAPLLAQELRVAAIDLPGMGRSDHRPTYSPDSFVQDLRAVADDLGVSKASLVGHSMGGGVVMHAVRTDPKRWVSGIFVDTPLRPPGYDWGGRRGAPPVRKIKPYPDLQTILDRFVMQPPQPCEHPYLVDYIARYSVQKHPQGFWTWLFDDELFSKMGDMFAGRSGQEFDRPTACVYGTESALCNDVILEYMRSQFAGHTPMYPIEGAHHHVMVDRPLELAALLLETHKAWKIM